MTNPNYAPTFNKAIRKGQNPTTVVNSIASRCRKTPTFVWQNLKQHKAAFNCKYNGQNWWCPTTNCKTTRKNWQKTEWQLWQTAIEFGIQQGWFTPTQVYNWTPAQCIWVLTNCFNKCYRKPKNFNPNSAQYKKPFWFNYYGFTTGATTSTRKRTTRKNSRKRTTRRTAKRTTTGTRGKRRTTTSSRTTSGRKYGRKTTRTTTRSGLRLVGSRTRYSTGAKSRRAHSTTSSSRRVTRRRAA